MHSASGFVNNLTTLFEAKHDVPLSNRADRAQEHVQRLCDVNATTEEVQAVLEMCKTQAMKVEEHAPFSVDCATWSIRCSPAARRH